MSLAQSIYNSVEIIRYRYRLQEFKSTKKIEISSIHISLKIHIYKHHICSHIHAITKIGEMNANHSLKPSYTQSEKLELCGSHHI